MRLVLASASPRRAELLRAAGFTFTTRAVDLDERVRQGETPEVYVRRLAMEKSALASTLKPEPVRIGSETDPELILAADTAVVVNGEILGKPSGDRDAERMLERLSGRDHEVLTGISLRSEETETGDVASTRVWFAALTPGELDWYVKSGEGRDKAGAYAIQGLASKFVTRIEGSYSNVVGLPVALVYETIKRLSQGFASLHHDR